MAAAGGGGGGGGRATTSGCGLKRRYAPHDQEEETMNQDQSSKEDWCGRLWNGMDLLKDVTENKHVLPTGLEGIDTLLGGGLRQGQLTEVTGPSSSGKTQVCLHSASHAAVKHMGVVMYLDTSNSFSPSRIATIIDGTNDLSDQRGFDLPHKERLKTMMRSIVCKSVFDIFGMFEVLHQLEVSLLNDKVKSGGRKICLLIVDSISSLLAPIIGGKYPQGTTLKPPSPPHRLYPGISRGRSMMISVAMILKKLAYKHNLSVLVTNHMVSAGNGAVKPALGESWKAVPHVRLVISREHGFWPYCKICGTQLTFRTR
ncbi:DNA repair protein RAD51 homolog 4-like isoform X2 [Miscanthus floridulus]|uniref:DNA repair protein RAD51 homolog 4-like isoform X2 n=1 Tax=Miscanthus floridulus TaxID=154761 RepID=UPI003457F72E